jgi:uncharacterized damage-inducible protein DinB
MHERFRETSAEFLGSFLRRIEDCVARLSEDEVWWRPNPAVNSVGNLLLHLHGNLSQWILDGLSGARYERHRDREFAEKGPLPKAELLANLERVVGECQRVIRGLSPEALMAPREIQGYRTDGVYTVQHVVEHMSYHTGQIVQTAKTLRGPEEGIEFYPQLRGK